MAVAYFNSLLPLVPTGLAFPVGVLGSEFTRVFNAHYEKLRLRIVEKKRFAKQSAALGNNQSNHDPHLDPSLYCYSLIV